MSTKTHLVRVCEARRITHPTFPKIEKHLWLVRASDIPAGVSWDANAREPVGLNRRVYREVKRSLMGLDSDTGLFDLMNKGITILAESVKKRSDDLYEITVAEGQGMVDGSHTYRIALECQNDPSLPQDQFISIQVLTGVGDDQIADIARGLNTGIQVQQHSLDSLDGKYDWIMDELRGEPYFNEIAWKESDHKEYDVRDLICILEALNVFDFPNDSGTHPIAAYEKWSIPTLKYSKDFDEHRSNPNESKYYRLRPLLKDALELWDTIRHDFRPIYNDNNLGKAAKLKIVEVAGTRKKVFPFEFAGLPPKEFRLTKGAAYPIFAAFRNLVEVDPKTGVVKWSGGFRSVKKMWRSAGPDLVRGTKLALDDVGNRPDQLGKNRGHWANMHQRVEVFLLRQKLAEKAHAA